MRKMDLLAAKRNSMEDMVYEMVKDTNKDSIGKDKANQSFHDMDEDDEVNMGDDVEQSIDFKNKFGHPANRKPTSSHNLSRHRLDNVEDDEDDEDVEEEIEEEIEEDIEGDMDDDEVAEDLSYLNMSNHDKYEDEFSVQRNGGGDDHDDDEDGGQYVYDKSSKAYYDTKNKKFVSLQ